MNKKVLIGIAIGIVAVTVAIIGIKTMLGDETTELPYEEETEKTLNIQEGESMETGESAEDEAREYEP